MSGRTNHRTNGAADFGGSGAGAVKSGSATLGIGLSSVAVTFGTPFPTGATYRVVPVFAGDPGIALGLRTSAKTEAGFTINAAAVAAGSTAIDWIAVRET